MMAEKEIFLYKADVLRRRAEAKTAMMAENMELIRGEQTRPGDAEFRSAEPAGRLRRHDGRACSREGAGAAMRH
jgi:hypothetical protein